MSTTQPADALVARIAAVPTPNGEKYRRQLCKHFAHKLAVTEDERSGLIPFTIGDCRVTNDETSLFLALTAPGEAEMTQLEDVVARHLVRFAFREELAIEWRPA